MTGKKPRFVFEQNDFGEPMFENFAKTNYITDHRGAHFAIGGKPDGIMLYTTDDGKILRVGLEIKSKQTTYAMTSGYAARKGPKEDHVKQTYCYSLMYDVDYYVILYVNGARKAWNMTPEEFEKNPDMLAFGLHITDKDRREVLDYFANIVNAATNNTPPPLDLDKWLFLDYKRAVSLSLSDEELAELDRQVKATERSGLPDHVKRAHSAAFAEILSLREDNERSAA